MTSSHSTHPDLPSDPPSESYSPLPSAGQLRLSDIERNHAVGVLSQHYADNRISAAEFDERCTAISQSLVVAQLEPVFADLPGGCPVTVRDANIVCVGPGTEGESPSSQAVTAVPIQSMVPAGATIPTGGIVSKGGTAPTGEQLVEVNVAEESLESAQQEYADLRRRVQRADQVGGVIMLVATIVGLLLLFQGVPLFWLSWVIGGLVSGIAYTVLRVSDDDEELVREIEKREKRLKKARIRAAIDKE